MEGHRDLRPSVRSHVWAKEILNVSKYQIAVRVAAEALHLKFKLVRSPQVVMVEKCQKCALRCHDSGVPRGWMAVLNLAEILDFRAEAIGDRAAGVRGAVVHGDHLQRAIGLPENTLESVAQVALAVVDWNYNAD
jgi:hypothetical protein